MRRRSEGVQSFFGSCIRAVACRCQEVCGQDRVRVRYRRRWCMIRTASSPDEVWKCRGTSVGLGCCLMKLFDKASSPGLVTQFDSGGHAGHGKIPAPKLHPSTNIAYELHRLENIMQM